MSIIPNANLGFMAPATSALSRDASVLSGQFNWEETAEAHVIKGEVPGMRGEEVKVELENGRVLHVIGERMVETQEQSEGGHCVQRRSSKVTKSFRLPANAQPDGITASVENGVLTITLPKINPPNALSNS